MTSPLSARECIFRISHLPPHIHQSGQPGLPWAPPFSTSEPGCTIFGRNLRDPAFSFFSTVHALDLTSRASCDTAHRPSPYLILYATVTPLFAQIMFSLAHDSTLSMQGHMFHRMYTGTVMEVLNTSKNGRGRGHRFTNSILCARHHWVNLQFSAHTTTDSSAVVDCASNELEVMATASECHHLAGRRL